MLPLFNLFRLFFLLLALSPLFLLNRNSFFFYFFKFAGPSFIKLGQTLSVRPDLVGENLAKALASFQDKVPSFSAAQVKQILDKEFGANFSKIFSEFNFAPVASASIAQVHRAKLTEGSNDVAVKILRPKIRKIVARDIATLKLISALLKPFSSNLQRATKDVAILLEQVARNELDFMREAASASRLKDEMKNVKGFHVPEIFWRHTTSQILVLEWINGTPFSNQEAVRDKLDELEKIQKISRQEIAKNFVISYFNQVYVYGFFHCDMHPGNLFLQPNGDIAVVDFGIMGRIDKKTRLAVAEILIGFLHREYKRVAQIHIDAGLVPSHVCVDDLALSCRKIGEAIVDVPVKEISLAKLLTNLIEMTNEYQMDARPDLLLLQKTLLLVEGVGVTIDPNLNMWNIAKPWVANWARSNLGFDAKVVNGISDLFKAVKKFLRDIA